MVYQIQRWVAVWLVLGALSAWAMSPDRPLNAKRRKNDSRGMDGLIDWKSAADNGHKTYNRFMMAAYQAGIEGKSFEHKRMHVSNLLDTYGTECDHFLLQECRGEDCLLSRTRTNARSQFSVRAVRRILEMSQKKAPVQYASFGSGELLSDFALVTDVLREKPDLNIAIHTIDPLNKTCLAFMQQSGANNFESISSVQMSPEKEQKLAKTIQQQITFTQFPIVDALVEYARHTQFVSTLKNRFPHASITYAAYADHDALQKSGALPDILVAQDIDNEDEWELGAHSEWEQLVRKNPSAVALRLASALQDDDVRSGIHEGPFIIETRDGTHTCEKLDVEDKGSVEL